MKYNLLIILLPFLFIKTANSQEFKLSFQTGYASFKMNELKDFNTYYQSLYPFDSKVVDNFPSYYYYCPMVAFQYKRLTTGFLCSYQSTGSRVSAKDYSGELQFDMKISSYSPGSYFSYDFIKRSNLEMSVYSSIGLFYSKLKVKEKFAITDVDSSTFTNSYTSAGPYFEPGLQFNYVYQNFTIGYYLGYFLQLTSDDFYSGNDYTDPLYNTNKEDNVNPDWTGIRTGITLSYSIQLSRKR